MLRTALVVKANYAAEGLRLMQRNKKMELVALSCLEGRLDPALHRKCKGLFMTPDLERLAALPELQAVIDATGDEQVYRSLQRDLRRGVELVRFSPRTVLYEMFSGKEPLDESRLVKEELLAVLNAVQDAIEVVDATGEIKYVNPAFTRVTGITGEERINRNIFEVSPHGALAQSLLQQKPVTAYRTYVGGSDADVISNASPIIVDGSIKGAVVVFQPVGDILKLMDELKHSNAIINRLYAQIDQLSGRRLGFEALVGKSKVFKALVEKARKTSRSDAPVLISGESGTGKSTFAQVIHNHSSRKRKPLIIFDCSEVPDTLQEIELFGCEKGALPGILRTRLGKIELAADSTLFIREINSLNPYLQGQVLRVMDEQTFKRIGSDEQIAIDVRIIASSGENLQRLMRAGFFSENLYRSLSMVSIELLPLRRRVEDISLLAPLLTEGLNRKLGKSVNSISPRALEELMDYDWPGNINELRSILERAMLVAEGSVIEHFHLPPHLAQGDSGESLSADEIIPIDKLEQIMLKRALLRYGESLEGKKKAARALNISLATLYNKLKKYSP